MTSALALLRHNGSFRRLWGADAVSLLGDWFSLVAVSTIAASAPGGGALALAGTLAAHLLPQSLVAPVAGILADRFDRRRVLVAGALAEGALTLAMLAAALGGQVAALQIALALRSAVSAAREPATGAALPSVVDKAELPTANTFTAVTWSAMFSLGMALGGVVSAFSPAAALAVDALSFALAAAVLRGLPALPPEGAPSPAPAASPALPAPRVSLRGDFFAAVRHARAFRLRRAVLAGAAPALAAGAGWLALNLSAGALSFGLGAAGSIGLLQAVRGAATAVGPLVARRFTGPTLERVTDLAALAVAAGTLALASTGALPVAIGASFVWGAGGGALWMVLMTEIQVHAAPGMRGRMIAFFGLGFAVTMSLGAAIAAALVTWGAPLPHVTLGAALVSLAGWAALRHAGGAAEPLPDRATATLEV